jgi:NAD(P)-dependent dehydrogenase (short-subunit alcohol dehydrogenase family)
VPVTQGSPMAEMLLEGKNAVIYGAGGAIGGAVARAFARAGPNLFLAGRKPFLDAGAEGAVVDVPDEASLRDFAERYR